MNRTIINPIIKDEVTFIRTSAETMGQCTEVMVTLIPGGGTPMHYHTTFAETFIATRGELTIGLDKGRSVVLQPGESFTASRMVLHRFYNATKNPIHFKVLIQPGSTGFEQSLRIMYGLATDGLTNNQSVPKKMVHTAVLFKLGDLNGKGILALLAPLLRYLAKKAKKNGLEEALVNKYCR